MTNYGHLSNLFTMSLYPPYKRMAFVALCTEYRKPRKKMLYHEYSTLPRLHGYLTSWFLIQWCAPVYYAHLSCFIVLLRFWSLQNFCLHPDGSGFWDKICGQWGVHCTGAQPSTTNHLIIVTMQSSHGGDGAAHWNLRYVKIADILQIFRRIHHWQPGLRIRIRLFWSGPKLEVCRIFRIVWCESDTRICFKFYWFKL